MNVPGSMDLGRAIFDVVLDAIVVADDDQRYVEVNEAACRLLGYSKTELLAMSVPDVVVPGADPSWDTFRESGTSTGLVHLRRRDGTVIAAEFHAKASVVEGQHVSVLRDVTERLREQQGLREAQALFEGAFDAAPVPMAMVDAARADRGHLLRANAALAALLGTTPEQLAGVDSLDLMHPDDRREAAAARPVAAREPIHTTPRLRRGDGVFVWTEITTTLVPGRDGSVDYMLAVVVDATSRRSAEEGRRVSDERFRTMVESSSEGVCTLDAEDRLTFVNPRMAEMLQDHAAALTGVHVGRLVAEKDMPPLRSALDSCREGRQDRRELCLHCADTTELPVIVSTSPLTVPDGTYGGVLMMVTDISQLVAAAEERDLQRSRLHDSQRLEGIGRLAGGIAHDFNNLLGVVINFAGFLDAELGDRPALRDDVRVIRTAAEQGAELTRQLLTFSRQAATDPELLDLRSVLRGAAELLRSVLTPEVHLAMNVPTEACMVVGDRRQLEHVLRSLAINACESMPDGGELALDLKGGGTPDADGRRWATLCVRDTGAGMPADVVEHAFEPFYTTKSDPGGGLGLAGVYGIVTDHRGQIAIESREGAGTTVTIQIPESDGPHRHPQGDSAGAGELVLLVDDDAAVRALTTRQLEQAGFTVVACGDPAEALLRPEIAEASVRMLVTDVLLPTMTGEQLADRVRERQPDAAVVFMSGYTDDDLARKATRDDHTVFVAKPFTGAELLEGVRRALERAQERERQA